MNSRSSMLKYLIGCSLLFSQIAEGQSPVSTTSPEMAVFSKSGNIPVSTYTGVPNISVPLFTIKDGDINLPISLSYNASGIKVEEDAGWGGLGWAVNAGGQITRAIRGDDDFRSGFGNYISPDAVSTKPLFTNGQALQGNPLGFYSHFTMAVLNAQFYNNEPPVNPFSQVFAVANGTHDFGNSFNDNTFYFDFQSDIYYFNAGEVSGKFVLDDAGNPMLFKKSKIKVERFNFSSFRVTTEDGLIYTFGAKVETSTALVGPAISHTSAWYLDKIESANGKNIVTFQYAGNSITTNHLITNTESVTVNGDIIARTDSVKDWINGWYLTEIHYNGGKVKFESVKDRTDVREAMRLSAVVVTDTANVEKLRYTLESSYFHATDLGSNRSSFNTDRLRLDKIAINGDENNAYAFAYNTDYIPSKDSGKDHWGYANHAGTGIPQGIYQVTKNINYERITNYQFLPGGDYEAHWPYTQAMNLKQITYPTKGYSRFTYESNTFSNVPTYWQYQIQTATINALSYPVNKIDNGSVNSTTILSEFYNLTCHFYLNNPADLGNIIISFYDPNYNLVYRKTLADFSQVVDGHNFYLTVNDMAFYTAVSCEVTTTRNTSVSDVNLFQFFNLQLTQLQQNLVFTPKQQMNGGGLRIKQIINNDGSGEQAYKQYQYNNDIGVSSGQIMNYPVYMSFATESPTVQFTADNFSSRSIIGLSTNAGGNYIGYSQVREIVGDSTRNMGSTVSYYTNLPDVTPYNYGINLPTEKRSENGLLLQQVIYDANNNKISRLTNAYSTFDQNNWKSTTGAYFTRYGVGDWKDGSYSELYLYKEYQLDYKLLNSTQKLFNQTDSTKFTQTFTAYQYQNNTNPRRVLKTNSLGGQDVTEYRYADDFVPGSTPPFVLQMQNANIFSKPIETVSLKVSQNTTAVKGSVNIYGTADQAGLLLNQYELYTAVPVVWDNTKFADALSTASLLNYEPHYSLKNTFGYSNLHKQITDYTSNGSTISYQWGYNNAYPVAQCKSATSSEFYYEGFEENMASGTSVGAAHTGTRFTTNPSVSWTIPNSRAYVISYWYFSGGSWQYSGQMPYTTSAFTMTGGSAYDDVRIHPKDAQMTTYTYLMVTGMNSSIDAKGVTTYYEYDPFQRLVNIRDKDGNVIKHTDYHYRGL